MPTVRFPNGDVINFPDGVPEEDIARVSGEHWTNTQIKSELGGGWVDAPPQEQETLKVSPEQTRGPRLEIPQNAPQMPSDRSEVTPVDVQASSAPGPTESGQVPGGPTIGANPDAVTGIEPVDRTLRFGRDIASSVGQGFLDVGGKVHSIADYIAAGMTGDPEIMEQARAGGPQQEQIAGIYEDANVGLREFLGSPGITPDEELKRQNPMAYTGEVLTQLAAGVLPYLGLGPAVRAGMVGNAAAFGGFEGAATGLRTGDPAEALKTGAETTATVLALGLLHRAVKDIFGHLRGLGMEPKAAERTAVRWKEQAAEVHPDRGRTPEEVAARTEFFKRMNERAQAGDVEGFNATYTEFQAWQSKQAPAPPPRGAEPVQSGRALEGEIPQVRPEPAPAAGPPNIREKGPGLRRPPDGIERRTGEDTAPIPLTVDRSGPAAVERWKKAPEILRRYPAEREAFAVGNKDLVPALLRDEGMHPYDKPNITDEEIDKLVASMDEIHDKAELAASGELDPDGLTRKRDAEDAALLKKVDLDLRKRGLHRQSFEENGNRGVRVVDSDGNVVLNDGRPEAIQKWLSETEKAPKPPTQDELDEARSFIVDYRIALKLSPEQAKAKYVETVDRGEQRFPDEVWNRILSEAQQVIDARATQAPEPPTQAVEPQPVEQTGVEPQAGDGLPDGAVSEPPKPPEKAPEPPKPVAAQEPIPDTNAIAPVGETRIVETSEGVEITFSEADQEYVLDELADILDDFDLEGIGAELGSPAPGGGGTAAAAKKKLLSVKLTPDGEAAILSVQGPDGKITQHRLEKGDPRFERVVTVAGVVRDRVKPSAPRAAQPSTKPASEPKIEGEGKDAVPVSNDGADAPRSPTEVPPGDAPKPGGAGATGVVPEGEGGVGAGEGGGAGGGRGEPGGGVRPSGGDKAPRESGAGGTDRVPVPDDVKDATGANRPRNFILTPEAITGGGRVSRIRDNVEAIRILKQIEGDKRTPTPEEQAKLARYIGWGQFPRMFFRSSWQIPKDVSKEVWEADSSSNLDNLYRELENLVSREEWNAARQSTLNAHYTAPEIVQAMWRMAERLGFRGGTVLEPAAGSGNFIGLQPAALRGGRWFGSELDPLTGRIAQLLYPEARIEVTGFQDLALPDNFVDLAISNVPFGDYRVSDPAYNKYKANIHDYFFLRSLDKVRPGGMVMFITSRYTMDKQSPRIREALAEKADLVAAIRLPGKTFAKYAGTEVVTDIVILKRRGEGEAPSGPDWLKTAEVPDPLGGEPIAVNEYFAQHPAQILGRLDRSGTMYAGGEVGVTRGEDFEARLEAAIQGLPEGIYTKDRPSKAFDPNSIIGKDKVKIGGFTVRDGKLYQRKGGGLEEASVPKEHVQVIKDLVDLRDNLRELFDNQLRGDDSNFTINQKVLNVKYDRFVKKHGPLHKLGKTAFIDDPDWPTVLALESWDKKAKKATKADIFKKRTISPFAIPETADTLDGALAVSLVKSGGVDPKDMAEMLGADQKEVESELVKEGLAYLDPAHGWTDATAYLSGNVRKKLIEAKVAAAGDPQFKPNVEALEKVQPKDIDPLDIHVKFGAPWVPESDVKDFIEDIAGMNYNRASVNAKFIEDTGEWLIDVTDKRLRDRLQSKIGTDRAAATRVLDAALNDKILRFYTKVGKDSVYDPEASEAAMQQVERVRQGWNDWIWKDPERRTRLHRHYNDQFNNIVPPKYNADHYQAEEGKYRLPGMSLGESLRDHQARGVWRVVTQGRALLAHEVGTGKTYTMVAGAMELRRLGLARKPAIVVPKPVIEQFTETAQKLYPGARILSTSGRFDKDNRTETIAQIATGDWDLVMMTHDNLNMLKMSPETIERFIGDEIASLEAVMEAAQEQEGRDKTGARFVKRLAKRIEALKTKLTDAIEESKKDDAVLFEETGIDFLFLDEAHYYKNAPVYSTLREVKGVPTSSSDRAIGLMMLTQWMGERNGGRGAVFATGTPISNTLAELYNMLRYLQTDTLKERGITAFDAWRTVFANNEKDIELSPSGEYKMVDRLATFVNLPELEALSSTTIDTVFADDVAEIDRPARHDHIVEVEMSDAQQEYMGEIAARAEALKGGRVDPSEDNFLKLTTDARKMSTDMRLVRPPEELGESFHSFSTKPKEVADRVLKIWKEGKEGQPNVQLVFSDYGIHPSGTSNYTLYDEIARLLVEGGMPKDKIIDFRKLSTNKKKKEEALRRLFEGEANVGIGSTAMVGVGVNVQQYLKAAHHVDINWRPDIKEQRDGRIWRDGNTHKDVDIFYYVTVGSFDTHMWQLNNRKSRFIQQYLKGNFEGREMREDDGDVLDYADIMGVASGDPTLIKRVRLTDKVKKLKLKERAFESSKTSVAIEIKRTEGQLAYLDHMKDGRLAAQELWSQHHEEEFSITVEGQEFTKENERAGVSKALMDAVRAAAKGYRPKKIGEYRGFELWAESGRSGGFRSWMKVPDASSKDEIQSIHFTAETDEGALASLEYHYHKIPDKVTEREKQIAEVQHQLTALEKRYEEQSPFAAELQVSESELAQIEERMISNEKPGEAEPEIDEDFDGDPDELGSPAPAMPKGKKKAALPPLDPNYDPHYTPKAMDPPSDGTLTTNAPNVIKAAIKAARAFGVDAPVRVGVKGKKRLGYFKVHPEVVRIKTANDIETVVHELGHAVEKAVFGWVKGSPWTPPLADRMRQQELVRLGKALYGNEKPVGGYKREGWAEFFRLWMTQPENAKKHAPKFFEWFENDFLANKPEKVRKALQEAQAEALTWYGQGSVNRAKESIVDPAGAKARFNTAIEAAKKWASPEFTYEMLHPLHEIARFAEEKLGRDLKPDEDPYFVASALRKTHYGRVKNMVENAMVDFAGNPIGPPLNDIKKLVKGKYEDFWVYMFARRASALWNDPNKPGGRNPGLTLEDAEQVIKELETPAFIHAAEKVYRWSDQLLDYAAEASPHFSQVVNKIKDVDPGDYIPLQRVFDAMTERYRKGGGGSVAKRLKGSGRQIKDPIQQLIGNASRLVRAAHTERVMEALFKLYDVEGMGQFIEEIPVDKVPVKNLSIGDLIDAVNERLKIQGAGVVPAGYFDPTMLDETVTFFQPAKKAPGGKRVVVRWDVNKKRMRWFEVNEELFTMLETMEPKRLNAVGEWLLGKPAALMRAGTVGYRASFQLIWNPMRDVQTMYQQTQTSASAPALLWAWAGAMKDAALYRIAGHRSPHMDLFIRLGGEMVQPLAQDIEYTRRTARRMHEGRVVVVLDPRNWFDLFRDIIQFPELGARLAELKLLAKEHGIDISKPLSEADSYFLLLAAKEVTTDFTAEGSLSRTMNRVIPFFNAQIQGPRAGLRAAKRSPGRFFGRGLQLSILTVALWLLNRDEDWYIETPWRERFLHWQLAVDWPEPTILRIPRAFELGMVFAALPEALLDTWYRKDPEAAKAWAETFVETTLPGFIPPHAEEYIEQKENKDSYTKVPIVPEGEKRLPREEQYNEYTTKVAIKLGEWLDWSPRRIDHAIRGILGPVGGDVTSVFGTGDKDLTRDSGPSDLPLVGRMFRREGQLPSQMRSVNKVYEMHEEAVRKAASRKHQETEEEREHRLRLEDAVNAISALNTVRQLTDDNQDRQKIQRLRLEIARDVLRASELPASPASRERFKIKRREAEQQELISEVRAGVARVPNDRSEAIRQALATNPDADWKELWNELEGASFSRGRNRRDFYRRFRDIKEEMYGKQ